MSEAEINRKNYWKKRAIREAINRSEKRRFENPTLDVFIVDDEEDIEEEPTKWGD